MKPDRRLVLSLFSTLLLAAGTTGGVLAQNSPPDFERPPVIDSFNKAHIGSSPFDPPEENDTTFVVDQGPGLDTGCTFRNGGPLIFNIEIDRVVGDVATLKSNGLISATARFEMPAFDVDFDANVPPYAPERDRVSFNGNVVPTTFLTGSDGVWKLNAFEVPIEWVEFADDPGAGGTSTPKPNQIRIDIDTANGEEVWCTAIDWASLTFEAVRPTVMVHGILSNGGIWNNVWVPRLNDLGILTDNDLNMGGLDSIGNNAAKIGVVVDRDTNRWGVDRVNLVVHSKGGLDSREYAENNDTVDQLLQLGTPNAGSPLANVAQAGSVVLFGLGGTAIVNLLAGPAGIQLTTFYMNNYNSNHGSNPKVQYTALGGLYDPDCFFCISRLQTAIVGPGDTIVPLSSAHALPYTIDRTYASSGADKDATHSGLHSSQPIFALNSDRVRRYGRAKAAGLTPGGYAQTATAGGELMLGDSATHTVYIDEAAPSFISVLYVAGDLQMVVTSPSGVRIDPAAAAADPDVGYEASDILGGRMAAYGFAAPEVGAWTVEIEAVAVDDPAQPTGYAINGWIEGSTVQVAGEANPAAVSAGQPLDFFATAREGGVPLMGATASAIVALPDDSTRTLALVDDGSGADAVAGDGVYSGRLADTAQSGFYRAVLSVQGPRASGATFSREAFVLATVSASNSSLNGSYNDFGRDTDGDGLFNELVVEVGADITAAADYRLFAVLTDTAGNTHEASASASLTPGSATFELSFDGEEIFQDRVDGPYTVAEIRLSEEGDLELLPVAEGSDVYSTSAYGYAEFEHTPISLTGGGDASGVDLNANGLFDLFNVSVEIELDRAGFYQWSGQLADVNGTELGFDTGAAFFAAGVNSLSFTFDGAAIGENGVDGPYFVRSLLVFGAGTSLVSSNAFTTAPFLASQFEGFVFDTTPPTLAVSLDPTVLWPPNHRMVDILASIDVQDDVDPNPMVRLVSITSSEAPNGTGDGNTTDDIQGADFGLDDREFSLRAERAGPRQGRTYTITYEAQDAAGNIASASATVIVPHNK